MYVFPSNYELNQIAPALIARMSETRVGLEIMPIREVQAATVEWDQMDNYRGLQQLRGLDGSPSYVKPVGSNRYAYEPGVYGEYSTVTETELTKRAGAIADITHVPIPVGDLVCARQAQLMLRELDRIEYMNWLLLTTGTFSVSSNSGVIFTDTFPIQTASRAVAWSSLSSATPMADFRTVGLLGRGKGASFGSGATAYMNRGTANYLLANNNASDLGGKRIPIANTGANTPLSIKDINNVFLDQDCAQIKVYDEGYFDDKNTWQLFIPNGVVVFVGKRQQGQRIGEYVKTINAVNPGRTPGSYSFVNDFTGEAIPGIRRVAPHLEVHQGHNGGPIIYYPGSVVVLTVL